jgi:hypothetical protein
MQSILQWLLKADWNSPKIVLTDWAFSLLTLTYGLYSMSYLWLAAGVLAVGVSWVRPMARIQRMYFGMIKRPNP